MTNADSCYLLRHSSDCFVLTRGIDISYNLRKGKGEPNEKTFDNSDIGDCWFWFVWLWSNLRQRTGQHWIRQQRIKIKPVRLHLGLSGLIY